MKPLALNLSKMRKVGGDAKHSVFEHPDGHQIKVAHSPLSSLQRKQIEKMPVHNYAEGGEANSSSIDDMEDTAYPVTTPTPPSALQGFGNTIRESASDALGAFKSVLSPVASGVRDFENGLVGDSAEASEMPPERSASQQLFPTKNQAPSADAPKPEMAQPASSPVDINKAYQQGQQGITEQQNVSSQMAKQSAAVQAKDVADRQALNDTFQKNLAGFEDHQQQLMNDYANNHINPNHYLENMTAPSRIATAIGMILGGAGAGANGVNPGVEFLQKQIERDISGQESRVAQQKTLLGANQEFFRDKALAYNQTRVNMNDIYDHQIQLSAAKLGTPQAKALADQAHAKFAMENAQIIQQNAARATALGAVHSGVGDPARLVPFLVPKEHQAKAFSEIEAAEDTRRMSSNILKNFEDAAKENTVLKTGFGNLRTPGSVYALHQAMQPTFKDLEGTVRQAAMENTFKNITPMPGDSDHKIEQKREALQGYLQSKLSAPTARGYGIDLSKFQTTAPLEHAQGQETKTMNGVPYQLGADGNYHRVR